MINNHGFILFNNVARFSCLHFTPCQFQQVINSGKIGSKKKEEWLAIGITVCIILTNEVEGMEWKTLIDGNREAPVLQYKDRIIDPLKLAWSKVKAGEPCNVIEEYKKCLD